jgi:hypothetical protein
MLSGLNQVNLKWCHFKIRKNKMIILKKINFNKINRPNQINQVLIKLTFILILRSISIGSRINNLSR